MLAAVEHAVLDEGDAVRIVARAADDARDPVVPHLQRHVLLCQAADREPIGPRCPPVSAWRPALLAVLRFPRTRVRTMFAGRCACRPRAGSPSPAPCPTGSRNRSRPPWSRSMTNVTCRASTIRPSAIRNAVVGSSQGPQSMPRNVFPSTLKMKVCAAGSRSGRPRAGDAVRGQSGMLRAGTP